MARARITSPRTFIIALAITLVLSLLPGRMLRWTNDLAGVVGIVFMPFADVGNRLGHWLRPPPRSQTGNIDTEYVEIIENERTEFERLYFAEQAKAAALEEQLQQLQKVPTKYLNAPIRPLIARIAQRSPDSFVGTVWLNKGSRDGVAPGTVAVYDGVKLIGRVTEDVSTTRSTLLPVTNVSAGLIDAVILPAGRDAEFSLDNAPKTQLEPLGNGTLRGHVHVTSPISEGDEVRLRDPSWPLPAQAMIVGTIDEIRRNDMQPLLHTIIVKPSVQISQLSFVTLKIEEISDESEGQP